MSVQINITLIENQDALQIVNNFIHIYFSDISNMLGKSNEIKILAHL